MSDKHNLLISGKNKFKKYLTTMCERNNEQFSHVSKFWKNEYNKYDFVDSFNFMPPEDELINIRRWNKRSAMGNGSPDKQIEWINKSYQRLMDAVPEDVIKEFKKDLVESDYGNPVRLEKKDWNYSGLFLLNLISTYYICNTIEKYYRRNNIDICEIGAGWGQACEILNQKLSLSSYTSIDLKETLFLSYLNACYNYSEDDIKLINDKESRKFNFCTPENIHFLEENNKQYDIFINYYSFQEMTKENVLSYVKFIKKKLKENGIFISCNSWGGAKYEIRDFTDLQLHNFEIIDIFKDKRSLVNGNKQLYVVCKNTFNPKKIDENKVNKLALLLRDTGKISTSQFLKEIYDN